MTDKERLIEELKKLHNQNTDYLTNMLNGTYNKKYSKKVVAGYKKLNEQLSDYIQDVEYGLECDKDEHDWCFLFADVLMDDEDDLDDDNFPIGGAW